MQQTCALRRTSIDGIPACMCSNSSVASSLQKQYFHEACPDHIDGRPPASHSSVRNHVIQEQAIAVKDDELPVPFNFMPLSCLCNQSVIVHRWA